MFEPGQRLAGTLFTIVDSAQSNSWREVICKCDCGKTVVLPYQRVYYAQYSCGCRRRPRADAVDYTSTEAVNGNGNDKHGRKLTVVLFDDIKQQWQYMCHCCSEIFPVPRGNERGLARTLRDIAGQTCPNYREAWHVNRNNELLNNDYNWLMRHGVWIRYNDPNAPPGWCEVPSRMKDVARGVVLHVPMELARSERRRRGGSIEYSLAHFLIPYYDTKHVIWKGRPKVLAGFMGMPTVPAKLPFYVREDQKLHGYFGEGVQAGADPVADVIDPDGFAEFSELTGAGDVEQQEQQEQQEP
jgi:hypothetical protein